MAVQTIPAHLLYYISTLIWLLKLYMKTVLYKSGNCELEEIYMHLYIYYIFTYFIYHSYVSTHIFYIFSIYKYTYIYM